MYDSIIIGTGPAGITAAIYTARAGLKTLVFGILKNSNAYKAHIFENYFGFENQITGPSLMETGRKQAERHGAQFIEREITSVLRRDDGTVVVKDADLAEYEAKTVIVASGLGFKPSGIKREKELIGRGVSFCVTCDGPFFKEKKVAIVGAGNFAGEEALMMLSFTKNIVIFSHGREFDFSEKISNELKRHNIELRTTPRIASFEGDEKLTAITFTDNVREENEGVFIALGTATAADFANELGLERNREYIVADPKSGVTNVPGVFAAGDCTGGNAQANKSAGEGCNAAISVIKFLKGINAYVDYA
ncbi:MAG: FAD-dependent oxidoreductase [Patescibacteria group bacterium]